MILSNNHNLNQKTKNTKTQRSSAPKSSVSGGNVKITSIVLQFCIVPTHNQIGIEIYHHFFDVNAFFGLQSLQKWFGVLLTNASERSLFIIPILSIFQNNLVSIPFLRNQTFIIKIVKKLYFLLKNGF